MEITLYNFTLSPKILITFTTIYTLPLTKIHVNYPSPHLYPNYISLMRVIYYYTSYPHSSCIPQTLLAYGYSYRHHPPTHPRYHKNNNNYTNFMDLLLNIINKNKTKLSQIQKKPIPNYNTNLMRDLNSCILSKQPICVLCVL